MAIEDAYQLSLELSKAVDNAGPQGDIDVEEALRTYQSVSRH
jgi:2-polyprenyl-6-methoxyphenol hydroxylase-like FAD-dependent oxidoreductase